MNVLAQLLFVSLVLSQAGNSPVRILEPTMYHGDEVDVTNGETWLGLYDVNGGVELRPVRIHVAVVNDPIVDADEEATGKEVSVDGDAQPFLLVRGLSGAKPGPIPSAYRGDAFLPLGETIALRFGTQPAVGSPPPEIWHLGAVGTAVDLDQTIEVKDYTLKLFRNLWSPDNERQTLATFPEISVDGAPRLLWAGDLDGDSKMDLLFDLTHHYNVRALTLFLSTKAKPGELVGKAAELITSGC